MITIQEAKSKKEITEFIKFPFSLYKDNKYWVPPLIADELETFDKTKNPAFENAEAYFLSPKETKKLLEESPLSSIGMKLIINRKKRFVLAGLMLLMT